MGDVNYTCSDLLSSFRAYCTSCFVFSQEKTLKLVLRVLQAFKASEIEKAVNSLDKDTVDVLMKYIYKGFEIPSDNSSAVLLTWHEKVGSLIHYK